MDIGLIVLMECPEHFMDNIMIMEFPEHFMDNIMIMEYPENLMYTEGVSSQSSM